MTTTTRTFYPAPESERLPDGFFLFSNGVRKRARYEGDLQLLTQEPVVPADPEVAADAARYNLLHGPLRGTGIAFDDIQLPRDYVPPPPVQRPFTVSAYDEIRFTAAAYGDGVPFTMEAY